MPTFAKTYMEDSTNNVDNHYTQEVFPDLVGLLDKNPEERESLRISQI